MKPNFEKQCVAINNRLKGLPCKVQAGIIYRRTMKVGPITRMWHRRRVYYCSECGCEVQWVGQHECPQCHAKWNAVPEYERRREVGYHMVMEAKGDIQLCRVYRVERYTRFGKAAQVVVWEVERFFYAPTGERKVFARAVQGLSQYVDAFSYGSEITIKREGKHMSQKAFLRYNLTMDSIHVKSLTKTWHYKDVPTMLANCDNETLILRVIGYSWAETWHKVGQGLLLRFVVQQRELPSKAVIQAVNICTRNHYIVNDPSLWLDHLRLLEHFGLDTHNAHYVCPSDLRKAHQQLVDRKRREDERREAMRRENEFRLRMERDRKFAVMVQHWPEHMGKILTLSLADKNLIIRPLQSIDEFRSEGEKMHHCVYAMEYWNYNRHPSSLILSAKDDEGHRLATIEYNMATNTIVQCRAACNAVPERDEEIRKLIRDNQAQFVELGCTNLKAA